MTTYTKIVKPLTNYIKVTSSSEKSKYGFGFYGFAIYGGTGTTGYTKMTKPVTNYTKVTKPL